MGAGPPVQGRRLCPLLHLTELEPWDESEMISNANESSASRPNSCQCCASGEVKVETNALKSLERWRAAARRLSATKVCSSTWLAVVLNYRSTDYLPVGLLRDLRV